MEVTQVMAKAGQELRYFMEYLEFFMQHIKIFIYLLHDFSHNPS